MSLRQDVDRVLLAFITRHWPEERHETYIDALRMRLAAHDETALAQSLFQVIDGRAGALLTHVSMMIAALGLCGPLIADNMVEEAVIFLEIGAYLVIAIGCLRCIASLLPHDLGDPSPDDAGALRRELILRQELYGLCNRGTIYLTLLVLISLPVLFVWTPTPDTEILPR